MYFLLKRKSYGSKFNTSKFAPSILAAFSASFIKFSVSLGITLEEDDLLGKLK